MTIHLRARLPGRPIGEAPEPRRAADIRHLKEAIQHHVGIPLIGGLQPSDQVAVLAVDHRRFENPIELSQKEFQMLKLFLENEGKVLSRQEILTKVWGFDYFGTDRTVDNFIMRLRRMVEPDPAEPVYLISVRGVGYKLVQGD